MGNGHVCDAVRIGRVLRVDAVVRFTELQNRRRRGCVRALNTSIDERNALDSIVPLQRKHCRELTRRPGSTRHNPGERATRAPQAHADRHDDAVARGDPAGFRIANPPRARTEGDGAAAFPRRLNGADDARDVVRIIVGTASVCSNGKLARTLWICEHEQGLPGCRHPVPAVPTHLDTVPRGWQTRWQGNLRYELLDGSGGIVIVGRIENDLRRAGKSHARHRVGRRLKIPADHFQIARQRRNGVARIHLCGRDP